MEPTTPVVSRSQAPKCPPAPRKVRPTVSLDRTQSSACRSLLSRLIEAGYICPDAPKRLFSNTQDKTEIDDIAKVLFA